MSGYGEITRGTPLGCLVGVLSLLPLILACIGTYGLFRLQDLPESDEKQQLYELSLRSTLGGLVAFIVLVGLARWIHKRTDWKSYDPEDPRIQM